MKEGIHPTYFPEATMTCACGNTWKTGSTQESVRTDVCSACHPFYTGEQRIVDTEGQVERFDPQGNMVPGPASPVVTPEQTVDWANNPPRDYYNEADNPEYEQWILVQSRFV